MQLNAETLTGTFSGAMTWAVSLLYADKTIRSARLHCRVDLITHNDLPSINFLYRSKHASTLSLNPAIAWTRFSMQCSDLEIQHAMLGSENSVCPLALLKGRKCRHFAHTLALLGAKHQMPVYIYGESVSRAPLLKALEALHLISWAPSQRDVEFKIAELSCDQAMTVLFSTGSGESSMEAKMPLMVLD